MPFNLQAATSKRSPADMSYEVPKRSKLAPPSAALLKDLDAPATVAPQTIPGTAPMMVVVLKVSDCAADSMPEYMGVQAGLFEIMMEHVAHPSFLYSLKAEFGSFLRYAHHTAADAPSSLEDLDAVAGHRRVKNSWRCFCASLVPAQVSSCRRRLRITRTPPVMPFSRRDGRLSGTKAPQHKHI